MRGKERNMTSDTATLEKLKAAVAAEETRLAFERRMLAFGYRKAKLGTSVYWFNSQDIPVFDEAGNVLGAYGHPQANKLKEEIEAEVRTYTVTELCPHCGAEVEMTWNTDVDGFKAFCPHCGKRLMLCDECRHAGCGGCDYNSEMDTCRHNPQSDKVGDDDEQRKTVCFAEAIFDIACNAQKLVDLGKIDPEDSRELFQSVYAWAKEFEKAHERENEESWVGGDYIVAIDVFARNKLVEKYGDDAKGAK